MKMLAQAITVALGALAIAGTAQAATYVVIANSHSFDAKLANRIQAAGGVVTARMPQIGVAIVESSDATFQTRAAKVSGVFAVGRDVELQFDVPTAVDQAEADYANPPASGDNDTRFDLQWG